MSTGIWTYTIPVISTGHAPSDAALRDLSAVAVVAPYEDGCFAYLWRGDTPIDLPESHAWLAPVVAWAAENKFEWVRFDSVGDEIDGLPTYDW